MDLPEFPQLAKTLATMEASVGASELHGFACGSLLVNAGAGADAMVKLALGSLDPADVLAIEAANLIKNLHQATLLQLQDPEMGLELLLPDDDYALEDRIAAACEWARGLVTGLALQGVSTDKQLPEDTRSFLRDCASIAESEYDIEESEQHEMIYVELIDYLRTGALMVQEEINPEPQQGPLH